jgi:NAD(P)-dependent dehydrogenase (short-subunit alcohol dehydrogenase family)
MQTALITGANKGIGLETARQLAHQGIHVIIGSRDAGRGQAAVEKIRSEGGKADLLVLDMASPESIAQAASAIGSNYGRLDILVNNAGLWLDGSEMAASTVGALSREDLEATYQVNFFGVVDLTQRLLPLLKASEAGRIVNLSSVLSSLTLHADPKSDVYHVKVFGYNSSKAALNAFTIHLAYELRNTKVKVNSAHPGWVKTDMGGPGALMEIEDGAKTSVWLATLPEDGPSGGLFHNQSSLPW